MEQSLQCWRLSLFWVCTWVSLNLQPCFSGEWEKSSILFMLAVQKARGNLFLVNMWLVCGCKHALSLLAAERSLITGRVYKIPGCFLSQALWLELLIMWHLCFPFRRCRTERLWVFPPWRCWWSHRWWTGHQEGWWSSSNCRNSQLGYLCQVCTEEYMSTGEPVPSLGVSIFLPQTDIWDMPFFRLG